MQLLHHRFKSLADALLACPMVAQLLIKGRNGVAKGENERLGFFASDQCTAKGGLMSETSGERILLGLRERFCGPFGTILRIASR